MLGVWVGGAEQAGAVCGWMPWVGIVGGCQGLGEVGEQALALALCCSTLRCAAAAHLATAPCLSCLPCRYDNEMGYSNRLVDLAIHMAKSA